MQNIFSDLKVKFPIICIYKYALSQVARQMSFYTFFESSRKKLLLFKILKLSSLIFQFSLSSLSIATYFLALHSK